jgi:Polyketide cyclase / dehydrase and lipid transport
MPAGLEYDEALEWFAREVARALPAVTVREQDELARSPGQPLVWYVTRREPRFRIDTSVEVPLQPTAAFAVYVDRVVEWQAAVQLTPRDLTADVVGSEYDACYEFHGRRYQGRLRVLAADPPRSVEIEAGGSGIWVWYATTFSPTPGGTRVQVRGDYRLPTELLTRIADRLGLERAITRDIERANEAYRRLCAAERRVVDLAAAQPMATADPGAAMGHSIAGVALTAEAAPAKART